jgi:lambda family phage portal protein
LQLIEPERLDNYQQKQEPHSKNGNQIRYGVERDTLGEPIAYHIRQAHQHESHWQGTTRSMMVERIERYSDDGRPQVLHLFDQTRVNMTRGVSTALLSTLKNMKMLSTFADAELSRQIQSASWAAVVESELDYEQAMGLLGRGGDLQAGNTLTATAAEHLRNVAPYYAGAGMQYNGSKVVHMMPGEKLKIVQSALQGAQYDMFEKAFLRQMAAGLNVSYESLTRDFSGVTYAAARMSMEDIWRRYLRIRQMITQQMGMPFFSAWLEEALMIKRVPMLGKFKANPIGWMRCKHMLCKGDFVSWGRPIIDPVKERTGQGLAMALGLTTLRDENAGEGNDWQATLVQRKREADLREKLKLNQEGVDPTLVVGGSAKSGNMQEGRKGRKDGEG